MELYSLVDWMRKVNLELDQLLRRVTLPFKKSILKMLFNSNVDISTVYAWQVSFYYWIFWLIIAEDGTLYSWGDNEYGELGIGTTNNCSSPQKVLNILNIETIHCGYYSSNVVSSWFQFNWQVFFLQKMEKYGAGETINMAD